MVRVAATTAVRIPRRTDYLHLAAAEQAVCPTHGATCSPRLPGRPLHLLAIETVGALRQPLLDR